MRDKKSIVVTGSSGFIGRALCKSLIAAGHSVHGLDQKSDPSALEGLNFGLVDILDKEALRDFVSSARPEIIVHLAARTDLQGATLNDYAANYDGVRNVIEAAEGCKRILIASSQLVFSVTHRPDSTYDYNPDTIYGYSKVGTELVTRGTISDKIVTLVRPTTIWGEGMSDHYRRILHLIDRGVLFHAGPEDRFKSYGYIGNIVHQLIGLMNAPAAKVDKKMFYLADYKPISLRRWIDALATEQGQRKPVVLPLPVAKGMAKVGDMLEKFRPMPFNSFRLRNMRAEYTFPLEDTESVCGPVPFTFEEAVRRTVAWHNAQP